MKKINYELNEKGKIISWLEIPFDPNRPYIEVKSTDDIVIGYSIIRNGKIYTDMKEVNLGIKKDRIRSRREKECFPIINRGILWYDTLTNEQKEELKVWYQAWLDATETLVVPDKPSWLS